MINANSVIRALLIGLTIVSQHVHGIVIRHDTPDKHYVEYAKQFANTIVYVNGCVGTIIDTQWVLTAAHCVSLEDNRPHFMTHLEHNYPVDHIAVHTAFNRANMQFDMALVHSQWPIQNALPALLYPDNNEIDQEVVFVGNGDFGNGLDGLISNKPVLRAATNTVIAASKHSISFKFDSPASASKLEGISGPGDSGGPALVLRDGKRFIAGVSSWQDFEEQEGVYGVTEHYARISTSRAWITKTLKAFSNAKFNHPLLLAVQQHDIQGVKKHIEADAKWHKNNELVNHILTELLFRAPASFANAMLKLTPELAGKSLSDQPLTHYAIELRHWSFLDALLDHPLDVNQRNEYGETILVPLLMVLPESVDFAPLLKKLLKNGLDINALDERHNTALGHAVFFAHRDKNNSKVKLLLENGMDPNITAGDNYTPLMEMARAGNKALIELLIQHGANTNIKDSNGKTAWDYARQANHTELAPLLNTL